LATDHPYEDLNQSMNFIRGCKLPDKIFQKICSGNAEKLGIKLKNTDLVNEVATAFQITRKLLTFLNILK